MNSGGEGASLEDETAALGDGAVAGGLPHRGDLHVPRSLRPQEVAQVHLTQHRAAHIILIMSGSDMSFRNCQISLTKFETKKFDQIRVKRKMFLAQFQAVEGF